MLESDCAGLECGELATVRLIAAPNAIVLARRSDWAYCHGMAISPYGASTMTAPTKTELTWVNFTPADLTKDQHEAYDMMIEARQAFEATFIPRDGFAFRFSYKGERLGVAEVALPKSREAVKQSLQDWLASKRAAGSRT